MFRGQLILIVEDELLIGLGLADVVIELGGEVIGPVATVHEALEILDKQVVAAAILDGRLGDRDITPVALRLASMGIPLVIHTGTGLPPSVSAIRPDLPVVMKPAPPLTVVLRLWNEMGIPLIATSRLNESPATSESLEHGAGAGGSGCPGPAG